MSFFLAFNQTQHCIPLNQRFNQFIFTVIDLSAFSSTILLFSFNLSNIFFFSSFPVFFASIKYSNIFYHSIWRIPCPKYYKMAKHIKPKYWTYKTGKKFLVTYTHSLRRGEHCKPCRAARDCTQEQSEPAQAMALWWLECGWHLAPAGECDWLGWINLWTGREIKLIRLRLGRVQVVQLIGKPTRRGEFSTGCESRGPYS